MRRHISGIERCVEKLARGWVPEMQGLSVHTHCHLGMTLKVSTPQPPILYSLLRSLSVFVQFTVTLTLLLRWKEPEVAVTLMV